MTEATARRPGTTGLRLALAGIPGGIVLVLIALGVAVTQEIEEGFLYFFLNLLGWIGTALIVAGVVGLAVGIWKRIA